jgi:hypothetical protein
VFGATFNPPTDLFHPLSQSGPITQITWDKWMTTSIEYGIVIMIKSASDAFDLPYGVGIE